MLRGAKKNGAVFTANSRYKSTEPWHSAALYKGEGAYTQRPVFTLPSAHGTVRGTAGSAESVTTAVPH